MPLWPRWSAVRAGVVALVVIPAGAAAQCPDGTPPPCADARVAVAAKRVNPPLDDRTWIVVPFKNVARNPDIEWLRDGSVNLLYLDMSRWRDVHVVDDRRVADYLRDIPGARAGDALSLNDGLAVARRAGAGNLVMGELIKLGSRTTVTATVLDVRRGREVRSVRELVAAPDSLMPTYGRLARGILALPLAAGSSVANIGTSRVDAYQEYVAGTQALNRFDAVEAKRRLERALQLDSTFALAHYKLAIASVYDEAAQRERARALGISSGLLTAFKASQIDQARLDHATAAARLATGLPDRERSLIRGWLAQVKGEFGRACDTFGALARADSSDVDALDGLGECSYHDDLVEAVSGDTTTLRFRSSWNTALRALRRVLVVDPTYHLAFDPVLAILTSTMRVGCVPVVPTPGPACELDLVSLAKPGLRMRFRLFGGAVRRQADSLVAVPVESRMGDLSTIQDVTDAERALIRRRNLEEALGVAREWVDAGPREARARRTLVGLLLATGRLAEADSQVRLLAGDRSLIDPAVTRYRVELAVKLGRSIEVVRLLDAAATELPGATRGPATLLYPMAGMLYPMAGRVAVWDSAGDERMRGMQADMRRLTATQGDGNPARARGLAMAESSFVRIATMTHQHVRLALGVAGDSGLALEREFTHLMSIAQKGPGGRDSAQCDMACAGTLAPSLSFGLQLKRTEWLSFDSTVTDRRLAPAVALSRGDMHGVRVAAERLDSVARAAVESGSPDDGSAAIAADAFLLVGDSAAAYTSVGRSLQLMAFTPADGLVPGIAVPVTTLWPRAMLLRADLAAATGRTDEAVRWYRQWLDLWAKADPEFQPIVARVRRAYRLAGGH